MKIVTLINRSRFIYMATPDAYGADETGPREDVPRARRLVLKTTLGGWRVSVGSIEQPRHGRDLEISEAEAAIWVATGRYP